MSRFRRGVLVIVAALAVLLPMQVQNAQPAAASHTYCGVTAYEHSAGDGWGLGYYFACPSPSGGAQTYTWYLSSFGFANRISSIYAHLDCHTKWRAIDANDYVFNDTYYTDSIYGDMHWDFVGWPWNDRITIIQVAYDPNAPCGY